VIGRKRAYVLGLLGYAVGAAAMTMAQGLGPPSSIIAASAEPRVGPERITMSHPRPDTTGATRAAATRSRRPWWLWALLALLALAILLFRASVLRQRSVDSIG
jgi:hypothetical protein